MAVAAAAVAVVVRCATHALWQCSTDFNLANNKPASHLLALVVLFTQIIHIFRDIRDAATERRVLFPFFVLLFIMI